MSLRLASVEIRGDEYPDTDQYPFNIEPLQGRQTLNIQGPICFWVGENGSGKSTLIEAVARRCGLDLWAQPRRRLAAGELSAASLTRHVEVGLNGGPMTGGLFTAEAFREWAEFLDEVTRLDPGQAKYQGATDLTARSHGEGILAYFRGRYRMPGLYFLDEPETALSPASQLEFLKVLDDFRRSGHAQFVIATHSPIIMALPDSQVFHFTPTGIEETGYESTEHFRLYRDFLADPGSYLS